LFGELIALLSFLVWFSLFLTFIIEKRLWRRTLFLL